MFLFNMMERDPTKRKVKPAQAIFDLEDLGESSDDSDFRIEDHYEESDDDSIDSENEQRSGQDKSEVSGESTDDSDIEVLETKKETTENITVDKPNQRQFDPKDALKIMICSVCLGDRSDAANEIIECDSCGVTVHEGCYGVQDTDSVCSSDSPCPTTPWFCDACKAGVEEPECELCPNSGGIFKETDVGKWVHLVCALYMPGVAFAEVDRLQNVTLFEMAYTKWGMKPCSLCQDQRFTRTGVTVSCDAGLCRTYFHVTCGQREGLLTEAHSEEVDQADPFYAHCKLHSDKNIMRKRRRNWLALQMRTEEMKKNRKEETELRRIERCLRKYQNKYLTSRHSMVQPWVPTQKMPRLLTTSASACKALWKKAELSGADTESWALRQAQIEALSDVHRRWHIQPAFSVEFIGYYLDRNVRVTTMRKQLAELTEENSRLLEEQTIIEEKRDSVLKQNTEVLDKNKELKSAIGLYYDLVSLLCPNKKLPDLESLVPPHYQPLVSHPLASTGGSVPTAAALKAGVGFSIHLAQPPSVSTTGRVKAPITLNNVCGLCCGRQDQHLLAKCDTCKKYYHLGCLNPPLTRMPKKTKLMGWQCSECDKESGSSDMECDTEAPRKLRCSKDNGDSNLSASDLKFETQEEVFETIPVEPQNSILTEGFRSKKRRREKHHRYSPDPGSSRPHKHKRKKSKEPEEEQRQSLKICIKSVPGGGTAYVATPSLGPSLKVAPPFPPPETFNQSHVQSLAPSPTPLSKGIKKKDNQFITCATCHQVGNASNLVRCDECLQGFHFSCLDPPVKKSPKVRGYSWHCANCDPTESD